MPLWEILILKSRMIKKILSPSIPYITVGIGLLVFRNAWVAILGYHIGMIIMILSSETGIPVKQIFRSNNYSIPIITAVIGASAGPLLYVFWPLLVVPIDINSYLHSIGLAEESWTFFLAYYILINPLIEEYYWRGYLGSRTKRIALNDLLFSGYHLIVLAGKVEIVWLIIIFLVLTFGAWFWRQFNRLSDGLLASTVSHITGDTTVILTIYFLSLK